LSYGCFLKGGGATREPDSAEDSKVQSLTLSGDPDGAGQSTPDDDYVQADAPDCAN
jgi:hypothetical protein